jgi:hypothetical protein
MIYEKGIIWTEKDKILIFTAYWGKEYGDYTACLKNAVNFLVSGAYKMNFEVSANVRGLPMQGFEMLMQFHTYIFFLPTHISPLQLKSHPWYLRSLKGTKIRAV